MKEVPYEILGLIGTEMLSEEALLPSCVSRAWRASFAPRAFATLRIDFSVLASRLERPEVRKSLDSIASFVVELLLDGTTTWLSSSTESVAPLVQLLSFHTHPRGLFIHLEHLYLYRMKLKSHSDFLDLLQAMGQSFKELNLACSDILGPTPTDLQLDRPPSTSATNLDAMSIHTLTVDDIYSEEDVAAHVLDWISLSPLKKTIKQISLVCETSRPRPDLIALWLGDSECIVTSFELSFRGLGRTLLIWLPPIAGTFVFNSCSTFLLRRAISYA
jgi:hypothetical protein